MTAKTQEATMPKAFTGKVALVTGGSRGIGAAIARRLAREGANVAIGYKSRRDAAEAVIADISRLGAEGEAFAADVSRADEVKGMVAAAVSRFGRIDIVVNNAGIGEYRPLDQLDRAFFTRLFEANVLSAIEVTQAALPHLPRPGGRVINIASRLAFDPMLGSSIYAATKSAIITLTHAFARELGPRGITVNCVAPGLTATDMAAAIPKERHEAVAAATPLRRLGQPEDIADIVAFLASEDARWMTGRTLLADGGMT